MSCHHSNPAGYIFCGQCGTALNAVVCRCGFVTASGEVYCGRCGAGLTLQIASENHAAIEHRFDLEFLMQQIDQEKPLAYSSDNARIKQEDIRKLFELRKKRL